VSLQMRQTATGQATSSVKHEPGQTIWGPAIGSYRDGLSLRCPRPPVEVRRVLMTPLSAAFRPASRISAEISLERLEPQRIGDGDGDQRFRQSMSLAVSKNTMASES
jgi:hypothetical protein